MQPALFTRRMWRQEVTFFECDYSDQVWKVLVGKLMGETYSNVWSELVSLISTDQKTTKIFTLKYVFQATIHGLWMERNGIRYGEASKLHSTIIRMIDRNVRNRFLSIQRAGDNGRWLTALVLDETSYMNFFYLGSSRSLSLF